MPAVPVEVAAALCMSASVGLTVSVCSFADSVSGHQPHTVGHSQNVVRSLVSRVSELLDFVNVVAQRCIVTERLERAAFVSSLTVLGHSG